MLDGMKPGNSLGKLRWEGARPDAREAVEIAWGNLRWEETGCSTGWMKPWIARRDEAVEIAWGNCAGRERDRMLDGMKPWK